VLFDSQARNLTRTPSIGPNVFLRDRRRRVTRLVSIKPGGVLFTRGARGVAVSNNGRYVLFETNGAGYLRDLQRGRTRRIARRQPTRTSPLGLSPDGRFLAYANYLSGKDLRVHDRATGHTFLVSLPAGWIATSPLTFTRDNRSMFFQLETPAGFAVGRWRLGAPHVRNLTSSTTDAILGGISGDGRFFAFESEDSTLIPGDTNNRADLFRQDVTTGSVERVNLNAAGNEIRSGISFPFQTFLSQNGAWVTFDAKTANTVAGDTNGVIDVFERGPLP
jgi:Tol biopolymer transport system component